MKCEWIFSKKESRSVFYWESFCRRERFHSSDFPASLSCSLCQFSFTKLSYVYSNIVEVSKIVVWSHGKCVSYFLLIEIGLSYCGCFGAAASKQIMIKDHSIEEWWTWQIEK